VSENKVQRRLFGPNRVEVRWECSVWWYIKSKMWQYRTHLTVT